jgi:hypothetical protein
MGGQTVPEDQRDPHAIAYLEQCVVTYLEQAAANETVARMMDAMGYLSDMSLDKNPQRRPAAQHPRHIRRQHGPSL